MDGLHEACRLMSFIFYYYQRLLFANESCLLAVEFSCLSRIIMEQWMTAFARKHFTTFLFFKVKYSLSAHPRTFVTHFKGQAAALVAI